MKELYDFSIGLNIKTSDIILMLDELKKEVNVQNIKKMCSCGFDMFGALSVIKNTNKNTILKMIEYNNIDYSDIEKALSELHIKFFGIYDRALNFNKNLDDICDVKL